MSYNIACAYALLGKSDEAIDWLKKAFEARFAEQETLEKDDDLDSIRKDPRFIKLTGLNPPTGLSPAEQWAWDLDFLVRRMEQMHWRLYDHVSKEEFGSAIDRLKVDAPKLSNDRVSCTAHADPRARRRRAHAVKRLRRRRDIDAAAAPSVVLVHRRPLRRRRGRGVQGTRRRQGA